MEASTVGLMSFIVQTGALGVLTLLIWLIPKALKDTLKEVNETNAKTLTMQHENFKLEREGFIARTKVVVDELAQLREKYPIMSAKFDKLIDEVHNQTNVIRDTNWPSDPDKICRAQVFMERIEKMLATLLESYPAIKKS